MRGNGDSKHLGRWGAWVGAAVLVAGSIGFTTPAFAAQSDNGRGHSVQGQAHKPVKTQHSTTSHRPSSTGGHSTSTGHSTTGSQGGSGVSLPRPNHYQAQSDPDGMENGGVDQPGGQGGVDTTSQDGNNGSGNDADCEDDNRGVGVPGHCKDRPAPVTPPVVNPPVENPPAENPPVENPPVIGGTTETGTSTGTPNQGVVVSAPMIPGIAPAGVGTASVSAPTAAAPASTAAAGVLPNTGAGAALFGLAIAALIALAVGTGLVRQGRRTARISA